jgi:hypothetical protein
VIELADLKSHGADAVGEVGRGMGRGRDVAAWRFLTYGAARNDPKTIMDATRYSVFAKEVDQRSPSLGS